MADRGVIHAIAWCRDCNWTEGDFIIALRRGRDHSKKTGHIVDVEVGRWYVYGEKKK